MTNKLEVIALHKAWPSWTAKKLAEVLQCDEGYISICRKTYGLDIPYGRTPNGQSVAALGRAAKAAGLTVEDIVAMGVGK